MKRVLLCLLAVLLTASVACGECKLLDFYAAWCGPCQAMTPIVDSLARDGYMVERIDIDRDRALAAKFNVTAIPCFVVVERGKVVDRIVGQTTIERLKVKLQRKPARVEVDVKHKQPRPAWRYEHPIGHRAAVVRIYCQDTARTRSIGSGVLVRWGKRIVVLTARHVVQDAKKVIIELHTKRTHYARVLKVDVVWDCAVLELVGQPESVEPVDVEVGDVAMQREGSSAKPFIVYWALRLAWSVNNMVRFSGLGYGCASLIPSSSPATASSHSASSAACLAEAAATLGNSASIPLDIARSCRYSTNRSISAGWCSGAKLARIPRAINRAIPRGVSVRCLVVFISILLLALGWVYGCSSYFLASRRNSVLMVSWGMTSEIHPYCLPPWMRA